MGNLYCITVALLALRTGAIGCRTDTTGMGDARLGRLSCRWLLSVPNGHGWWYDMMRTAPEPTPGNRWLCPSPTVPDNNSHPHCQLLHV
eukprot:364584-Chlamydomonas_euryale.AAC.7